MTSTAIAFTELLGRRVRMGDWQDQKVSTYQKIRDALAATNDLPTATGHITFNELGEIQKIVQAQVVKDGAYRHYAVIDDPELLAPPSQ